MSTAYAPFVYGLVDPDDIGHIRYVGMAPSRATRPYDHARAARKATTKDTHQIRWIRKIQAEGRDYLVTILEENPPGTDRVALGARETHWILTLRGHGHRLTNENAGGWGGSNGPHTRESKIAMRDGWTPEVRARVGAASRERMIGVPRSVEARVKQGKTTRGRKKSEETKRAMAEARARAWAEGKYDSSEYHKKLSDAAIASGHSAAIGRANLGKHHTDDTRAQMSASHLARLAQEKEQGIVRVLPEVSDETRALQSVSGKAAWGDEERRAQRNAAAKATRERHKAEYTRLLAECERMEQELAARAAAKGPAPASTETETEQ